MTVDQRPAWLADDNQQQQQQQEAEEGPYDDLYGAVVGGGSGGSGGGGGGGGGLRVTVVSHREIFSQELLVFHPTLFFYLDLH